MHFASDITQWAPRQLKESMMRPLTVIMITIMIMTTMIMKLTHLIRISPILSSPSLTSRSCPYSGNYIKFGITQTAFMWNQNLSFSSLQNATNCGRKGPKGGPSINFHVVGGEVNAYIITFGSVLRSIRSSRSTMSVCQALFSVFSTLAQALRILSMVLRAYNRKMEPKTFALITILVSRERG